MNKAMKLVAGLALLSIVACSHGGHHDHHHGHKAKMMKKNWQEMDTNQDGNVTKEEFDKFHADKFKKMDANSDGKVTKEEKKAYKKAMKAEKSAMTNEKGGCCS